MKRSEKPSDVIAIVDEPGMAERFQRGLQRALNTPPQHRMRKQHKKPRKGEEDGPNKTHGRSD